MKKLIIGFGTGRCGTKSLAAFLDQQPDVECTHEDLIPFDPHYGNYMDVLGMLIRQGESTFQGNISTAWINYIDRIMMDVPTTKFLLLQRDPEEVVESFHSYIERQLSGRPGLVAVYPVFDKTYSKDAVRRSIERYKYKERVLLATYPHSILRIPIELLETETAQVKILDFIGLPRGGRVYGMPHLNKREDMSQ